LEQAERAASATKAAILQAGEDLGVVGRIESSAASWIGITRERSPQKDSVKAEEKRW
jgi:hypothetical protein